MGNWDVCRPWGVSKRLPQDVQGDPGFSYDPIFFELFTGMIIYTRQQVIYKYTVGQCYPLYPFQEPLMDTEIYRFEDLFKVSDSDQS